MSRSYRPVDARELPELLADRIDAAPVPGLALRVAIDGPPCAGPEQLAAALVDPLRMRGRAAVCIPAASFWRDASLRLEHGRTDVDSYLRWLDADALRRELLDPTGPDGDGNYLRSLRDPDTNRMTRAPVVQATPGTVVLVGGTFLLGAGLPFDLTVHLAVSPAARARRTDPDQAWTLPAFERYDADTQPVQHADVVLRVDDPRHPALAGAPDR